MKTATDIDLGLQQDLIEITKDLLAAAPEWATDLPMRAKEPYMTLKQFQALLGYCSREREQRTVHEYVRYPLMTMDHPLHPLFQIEDQAWYVMLPGMRGGHTGYTYAIPLHYCRPPIQHIVTAKKLSQPYDPPARLVIKHYVQHSNHCHHNNHQLLWEDLKRHFPQYSRQTIWRAIKSISNSSIIEGGRT